MTTVQDIFNNFYNSYKEKYTPNSVQSKTANDIMKCRTLALGGHVYECEECDHSTILYNSCRNRHCNICQSIPRAIWVDDRTKDVIDAPYFHVVFTVPDEIRMLIYQNQKELYNLMYKAVSETLSELSWDPKYLGAQIGFMSALHTWSQDLMYHPHLHVVVLAGGLTKTNGWKKTSKKFFIPVKVLAKKFRGKFIYYLKKLYKESVLSFHGTIKDYENPMCFASLINQLYKQKWYTYTKKTFSGALGVIKYLSQYTHRVAISNNRIVSLDDNSVTITTKERKNNKLKNITLTGVEFIRRFLMHVLPSGFVKIRYYGIMASRNKKTKLELCRYLTSSSTYTSKFDGLKTLEIVKIVTGKDVTLCPRCKQGKMRAVKSILAGASP